MRFRKILAVVLGVIATPILADEKSDQWTAKTIKLVGEIVSGAKHDRVVFPDGFGIRIGIHPSDEPAIIGGFVGKPDILAVTRGFIVLAEQQGLSEEDYRAMVAHEVGHMVLGHKLNARGRELEEQELAADEFARQRLGPASACAIAHALHTIAEPRGGWRDGSLEKRREILNNELCRKAILTVASK